MSSQAPDMAQEARRVADATGVSFGFSHDQRDFAASVAGFARTRLAPYAAEDDRLERFRRELLDEMAGLGLTGLRVPEEYGGQGADAVMCGIACEEVCRVDLSAGYLVLVPALIAEIITRAARPRQAQEWLEPVASGDVLPAFCLTEPDHGSDAAALSMRAEKDGSGWRLTGEKTSITYGAHADAGIVFARTGDGGARGITAFYFHFDDDHMQRSSFRDLGGRSIGRASLAFDGHPVGADAVVGGVGEGFIRCMQGFDYSRALIGLMCLGCAQGALDEAVEYARERTAFGGPLSRQQGVAFPLVEQLTLVRAARLLCYEALWRKDAGLPHVMEAGMVKWWAPKLSVEAIHQALLVFGHSGYSDEVAQGRRLRDTIGLEIGDGTAQIAKLVAARELFGRHMAP